MMEVYIHFSHSHLDDLKFIKIDFVENFTRFFLQVCYVFKFFSLRGWSEFWGKSDLKLHLEF